MSIVAAALVGVVGVLACLLCFLRPGSRSESQGSDARDRLSTFLDVLVEHPHLRPYFHDGRPPTICPDPERLWATAEMLAHVLEGGLRDAAGRTGGRSAAWRAYAADMLRTSPTLVRIAGEHVGWWPLLSALVHGEPPAEPAKPSVGTVQRLPRTTTPPAPRPGGTPATVVPPLEVLEPLDHRVLAQRSGEIFPQGYLTNISIIQGVALGVLLEQTFRALSAHGVHPHAPIILESAFSLVALMTVSYEYLWFSTVVRWTPTFRDTAVPVVLGVGEIVPPFLLTSQSGWWFATAVYVALGGLAFLNTASRLHKQMFTDGENWYLRIRHLLINLAGVCFGTVAVFAGVGLAIRIWPDAGSLVASVASAVITASIAGFIILYSEKIINDLYEGYGIIRRPPLFRRIQQRRAERTSSVPHPAPSAGHGWESQ
jgi:hypothetical protein